jgi:hypothetical protein
MALRCDWIIVISMRETRLYYKGVFDQLLSKKAENDAAFGEGLDWQRMDDQRSIHGAQLFRCQPGQGGANLACGAHGIATTSPGSRDKKIVRLARRARW